jgi:hypothetical protein
MVAGKVSALFPDQAMLVSAHQQIEKPVLDFEPAAAATEEDFMPSTVKWACVLIALSVLQGMFNLRYVTRDTPAFALPAILALCVLLILLAGAACRRRWTHWIYVSLTIAGVIIFILRLAGGLSLANSGIVSRYIAAILELTPMRTILQLVSVFLLLSSSSRTWFRPQDNSRRP